MEVKLAGVIEKKGEQVYKKVKLRFIDSCRFMASSLDELASNLDDDQCKNLRWFYRHEEDFNLMRRKGVYPYEYVDGWEKFKETALPPKEAFYSKLYMRGISDGDYEHARKVWNCMYREGPKRTLGDYHDVYLATDVLSLADVFESFREMCMEHYKLDPAHFYSAPGLAWKAAFKETGINLELLTDIDKLLMFDYNPEETSKFFQYLDANSLYAHAIVQKLPTHGFAWINQVEKFKLEFIRKLVEKDHKGYILEVDVDYLKTLHKSHNEILFLPERMKIGKVEKLVPNLNNKRKYVEHIRVLDQALKHGIIWKKVH